MNKLIIAGGTGFLGKILLKHFKNKFNHIIILSRTKSCQTSNVNYIKWNGKTTGNWVNHIEGAEILINLSGKSVDCRYNKKNKEQILSSRLDSTNILNKVISKMNKPPKLWINASTATIYRHSINKQMDEYSGEIGSDFSMDVAKFWEHAFFTPSIAKTRKVAIRTAIVLGKKGGALIPIKKIAQFGLGGRQGKGEQFISWIHEEDFVNAVEFIITNSKINGVINIVSPEPVKNYIFMKQIRKQLNIPFGVPLSKFFLKIGAFIIKTETELILKSRNVIPGKLEEEGFNYKYSSIDRALEHLLKKD
ncbi:TIGR01777 family protein [Flavobacteriaceae bacterium R38]|nr:TIGR01777 family protein [Flavobacteriaceae bacterium R38]